MSLWRNYVTDVGAEALTLLPSLRVLSLDETKVTDAGLRMLASVEPLRELRVSGTKVTAAGIREFRKQRPDVRLLHDVELDVSDDESK